MSALRLATCGVVALHLWAGPARADSSGARSSEAAGDEASGPDPAAGEAPAADEGEEASPPARKRRHLEISFGSSVLILEQPLVGPGYEQGSERLMAVDSAMLLCEWLVTRKFTISGVANIPLVPLRKFKGDEVVEEHVSAVVALGPRWSPIEAHVFDSAWVAPQLALLLGRTLGSTEGDLFFPLSALRLHISTADGFTMHLGIAYAFRKDTLALTYGVGHQF